MNVSTSNRYSISHALTTDLITDMTGLSGDAVSAALDQSRPEQPALFHSLAKAAGQASWQVRIVTATPGMEPSGTITYDLAITTTSDVGLVLATAYVGAL